MRRNCCRRTRSARTSLRTADSRKGLDAERTDPDMFAEPQGQATLHHRSRSGSTSDVSFLQQDRKQSTARASELLSLRPGPERYPAIQNENGFLLAIQC